MTMWGFIIGTGTVWLLSALIVMPLAQYLTSRRLKRQGVVISDTEALASDEEPMIALDYYIIADVLVLGIAGFIMGAAVGWFFIGISFDVKGWPGLLAFIGASFAGAMLHGPV
jgi:hypothetical protein